MGLIYPHSDGNILLPSKGMVFTPTRVKQSDVGGTFMGVIRVTARPSKYAAYAEQEVERIRNYGIQKADDGDPARERAEVQAWQTENEGRLTVRLEVGGVGDMSMQNKQKRILEVINQTLHKKGTFVRDFCSGEHDGFCQWDQFILHGNIITTAPFPLEEIDPVLRILQALDAAGWYPEHSVDVQYSAVAGGVEALYNLLTILESRRPLIEEALSLKEPFQIILRNGVALGIMLSAFSYTAVEAAAFLLEQAWKMALATGKARMKPCSMSNPKYQMRSWLLRLGFIGERFERPRKTLLEGLPGDIAFYDEDQKRVAAAKRKASKLNGILV